MELSRLVVATSTPTTLVTSGYLRSRATCPSSTTLCSRSALDRCATVKSALPVCSTAAAVVRKLCVTTPSVTTVITPIATASAVSALRNRLVRRLCTINPTNDTP